MEIYPFIAGWFISWKIPSIKWMIRDVPTIPLRSKGYVTVIYHDFFPKIWLPEMDISRNDWGG